MIQNFHSIDTGSHPPFKSCPYRKSHSEEKIVANEIKKLLDSGLIVPSRSHWTSPIFLIKKKQGENCIVMDYQKLNSLTKKDSYPITL